MAATSTKIVMIIDMFIAKVHKGVECILSVGQKVRGILNRTEPVHDKVMNPEVKDQDCKAPVQNIASSFPSFPPGLSQLSTTANCESCLQKPKKLSSQESSVSSPGVLVPVHGQ